MSSSISQSLQHWYLNNKRDLPWRDTRNPYFIWLSEIILQQTRVEQGLSYYLKFIDQFPNIKSLANAKEDDVLKLWQGLGYYSRARNLHFAAKQVRDNFDNNFPSTYESIIKLKGVGEYTAAAIASIAYNQPYAVVDGNVYRVLSRLFAVKTPIDTTKGKKDFSLLANEILDKNNPSIHNQAMMELGALICKPQNPLCIQCPISAKCIGYAKKITNKLPVKIGKTKVRSRYFDYLVIEYKGNILLQQREEKDIWKGLYEFPLIESTELQNEKDILKHATWKKIFSNNTAKVLKVSTPIKHILSHQIIYARFWEIKTSKKIHARNKISIPINNFEKYPISRLSEKYWLTR